VGPLHAERLVVTENLKTKTIVGLEIHVQLATRTKLFCGCALEFGAEPNSPDLPGVPRTARVRCR
jgi:Asp-tRNA(Asn)/Glu-tRNA(Gln) amidotransferase B subunit